MRCLECGAESAEATEVCARCGAPTSYQPSAADPAVAQQAGRSGPSRRLLITVGAAAALGVVVGLIAGLGHSGSSASSIPSTDQLTIYQLRAGDCLQGSGQTLANFNQLNGPFTVAPCTQPHTDEVFFAGNAWPRSLAYPGDQAVYDDGLARCIMAFSVSIHGGAVNWCQFRAGSGGSQGLPSMAARMASRAVMPWAAAESR